ncbi:MAG: DNA methyltransferase [Solirubrobacterales bacterium]
MAPAAPEQFFAMPAVPQLPAQDNRGAFTRNMTLPIHRWFRYSAGFSAAWAETVIQEAQQDGPVVVLDPFMGSGTTLLAAQAQGANAIGFETHPLVRRISEAKLAWDQSADEFECRATAVLERSVPRVWTNPPALLAKIYPPATLATLLGLRHAIEELREEDEIDDLLWLALIAVLRPCSPVGTAQWQYVLPKKSKAKTAEPVAAFSAQVRVMTQDMRETPPSIADIRVLSSDARAATDVDTNSIDLVLTSPPYPNNYDYADATRIEMTFLGEIKRWADLQATVRRHLVRSCSQHMAGYEATEALEAPEVAPIRNELIAVYERLATERENRSGRKAYHSMVAAYFHDLARTWVSLRRVCRSGSVTHFVVGDSAPYAVHVPVERWLGELALGAGFASWEFEKLRDRNTKWKNRKHRVPLQEGILTVLG